MVISLPIQFLIKLVDKHFNLYYKLQEIVLQHPDFITAIISISN